MKSINTESIPNVKALDAIVQLFASNIDKTWLKHSKVINITKRSITWWNDGCCRDLNAYRQSG